MLFFLLLRLGITFYYKILNFSFYILKIYTTHLGINKTNCFKIKKKYFYEL